MVKWDDGELGDAAKRVRRARRMSERTLDACEKFHRDLDRGRVPEGVDPVRMVGTLQKWMGIYGKAEADFADELRALKKGLPGRAEPIDLAAARDAVLGRLARLAAQAAP